MSEIVDLDIEEANELAFKIKMEGVGNNPVKVRLVCESKDVSYMFNGYSGSENDVVHFVMPEMKNRLSEGVYPARVEVLVDNKYFTPVNFQINFKKTVNVVAEQVQMAPRPVKPEIKITAQPIVINKVSQKQEEPVAPVKKIHKTTALAEAIEAEKKNKSITGSLKEDIQSLLKAKRR